MNNQPIHIVTGDGRDMWVAANTDANPEFFDTREEAEKAIFLRKVTDMQKLS